MRCQLLEVAEGLEYLHAQKVVHGDIKEVCCSSYCHILRRSYGIR
jgi:serine/threonine protein kinase